MSPIKLINCLAHRIDGLSIRVSVFIDCKSAYLSPLLHILIITICFINLDLNFDIKQIHHIYQIIKNKVRNFIWQKYNESY